MPIRSKHCRMCQKCVSTYDHHCPWLGNCVGERNRKNFYIYLWFQQIQLLMIMFLTYWLTLKNNDPDQIHKLNDGEGTRTFGWIAFSADIIFQFFVSYLIVFHSYLALSNMTTWECLSWDKISYLKLWPRNLGSPFNAGIRKNLECYFSNQPDGESYNIWKMP